MKDSTLVVYPTALKVRDQLTRLSRVSALLGHRLTTLPQVVEAIWLESDSRRAGLNSLGERLVMREIITRIQSGHQFTQGSIDRFVALVQRLKGAAITADEWRIAIETLPPDDQVRLADFTIAFMAYQDFLSERGLADRHDREAATLSLLHKCEASKETLHFLSGVERLLVAEIYDLSLLQFMIVAALIRMIGDAELTIQAEPHKVNVSRFMELTWNRFVGEESIADKVLPAFVRREGRTGRLGFLLEHIFTGKYPDPPSSDESVTIVQAANPRGEAEQAARMIRSMLEREPTMVLERIGIVARDFDAYAGYLESVFRRYRIPLALQSKKPLRVSILARVLLALLRVPLDGYRRESLLAVCDAPLIDPRLARFRSIPLDIGYIDRTTKPFHECVENYSRRLTESVARQGAEEQARLTDRLDHFQSGADAWLDLLEAFAAFETTVTIDEHLENLRTLLERLRFDPLAGSLIDSTAKAAGALWRMLDEVAAVAAQIMPERRISLREFIEVLELGFASTDMEIEKTDRGAVHGLSVLDARGLDFDVIFILGLSDGKFPLYHPEDPLIPDRTIRELNRAFREQIRRRLGAKAPDAPGPILRSSSDRNSEEPFLFFLALSMPTRAIVLSRSIEDAGGKPLACSPFLEEISRLLGEDAECEATPNPDRWEDAFVERDFLTCAARERIPKESLVAAGIIAHRAESIIDRTSIQRKRENYLAMPNREELFAQRRRAKANADQWLAMSAALAPDSLKYAQATTYDGHVGANPALRRFLLEASDGGARRWSATQLTELASCGFRFFAGRLMLLSDDNDPDYEPTAVETGNWAHQILHEFLAAKPNFSDLTSAQATARAITAKWQAQARDRANDVSFFDAHWNSIKEAVEEAVLYEFARREAGDAPDEIKLEHPFTFLLEGRDASGAEALRITLDGRIDRLELYRDPENRIKRLRVIDYKNSGSRDRFTKLLKREFFGVTDLQMAAYLLGAVKELRDQLSPETVAEVSYIALKHRKKETHPLSVPLAMLDNVQTSPESSPRVVLLKDRVIDLVGQAVAGRFDIDPLECSDLCPYRRVCRFDSSLA